MKTPKYIYSSKALKLSVGFLNLKIKVTVPRRPGLRLLTAKSAQGTAESLRAEAQLLASMLDAGQAQILRDPAAHRP